MQHRALMLIQRLTGIHHCRQRYKFLGLQTQQATKDTDCAQLAYTCQSSHVYAKQLAALRMLPCCPPSHPEQAS